MAVTAKWYTNAFFSAFGGSARIQTEVDVMKVSMHTITYTPAQTTDDYWNDATNEVSSANYTTGGYTLLTLNQTVTSNVWNWTAANPAWTTITCSPAVAVYYDSSPGTAGTDPLISYLDFGGSQVLVGVNFSITHDAAGIVKVTT